MEKNTYPSYPSSDITNSTKLKFIFVFTIGLSSPIISLGQESVNTSGGDATGSGGSVAYSIGQVVYTTYFATDGSVAQGVQHAYEIFSSGTGETLLNVTLIAYPNPTSAHLTLLINDYNNEKLSYQILDVQGKQLSNGQVTAKHTQINTNGLPNATYFINVVNEENLPANKRGKIIQSFKIIKQ
ncbi:MAG: T9SS type A sorting domain-containing protein [Sphingomonadales bacterium]|nr:T9SS type A sorting domain-containing protein [Sphingomonadales bacterium]